MDIKEERDFNDPDITLGMTDDEMTERFQKAVELAILKAKAMGLPVQRYDADRKRPYLEYPDGTREYV